jgi:hypothetical protein
MALRIGGGWRMIRRAYATTSTGGPHGVDRDCRPPDRAERLTPSI